MTVHVTTSSAIQQTDVQFSTQSPIWNQDFHFSLFNQDHAVLSAVVKSKSAAYDDQSVSEVDIQLASFENYDVVDKWFELISHVPGQDGGKCRIILQVAPAGHPAFQANPSYEATATPPTFGSGYPNYPQWGMRPPPQQMQPNPIGYQIYGPPMTHQNPTGYPGQYGLAPPPPQQQQQQQQQPTQIGGFPPSMNNATNPIPLQSNANANAQMHIQHQPPPQNYQHGNLRQQQQKFGKNNNSNNNNYNNSQTPTVTPDIM